MYIFDASRIDNNCYCLAWLKLACLGHLSIIDALHDSTRGQTDKQTHRHKPLL